MLFRCQSTVGLKCSFLDDGGMLQTWEYLGGAWDSGSFSQVGAGKLTELDDKTLKKGFPVFTDIEVT